MSTRPIIKAFALIALIAAGCASSKPKPAEAPIPPIDYAWVEMVPAAQAPSQQMARVITRQAVCPELNASVQPGMGKRFHTGIEMRIPMKPRAAAAPGSFDVLSCETPIPVSTRAASIAGRKLAILPLEPKRILVLGDTGCRIKGSAVQACNDPALWPFPAVAKAAAAWKPDLVIHVGDYYYRESPCPAGNTGCEGAHSGDNWLPWQEDLFAPADPLLQAAPWVFARGNHEDCKRGGKGWDRFLEPRPYAPACNEKTDPYPLMLGDHRLWVIDSAAAENIAASLPATRAAEPKLSWLVTHRPFLAKGDFESNAPGIDKSLLPKQLQLILTGHLHQFRIHPGSPVEIITGNGGTKLDSSESARTPKGDIFSRVDFGFLGLEKLDSDQWRVTEHDRSGAEVLSCVLQEHAHGEAKLDCASTAD
ncbi:MAG: metallophosphoesterase [Oligoflexia bacterium]|nr:metallophosphoesterase [Oligoflexia bacterium]